MESARTFRSDSIWFVVFVPMQLRLCGDVGGSRNVGSDPCDGKCELPRDPLFFLRQEPCGSVRTCAWPTHPITTIDAETDQDVKKNNTSVSKSNPTSTPKSINRAPKNQTQNVPVNCAQTGSKINAKIDPKINA